MATDPAPILSNSYGPEVVPPHVSELPEVSDTQASPSYKEAMTKSLFIPLGPTVSSNRRENSPRFSSLSLALLVFLATVIVVGGGLGGGLGAELASCQSKLQNKQPVVSGTSCPSPSATPSASTLLTNYSVAEPSNVDSVALDCPNLNNQEITTQTGDKFTFSCGFDVGTGLAAQGGGTISDIVGIISYSVSDCVDACSEFSRQSEKWGVTARCTSVTFDSKFKNVTQAWGGNCWLKNGTVKPGVQMFSSPGSVSGMII